MSIGLVGMQTGHAYWIPKGEERKDLIGKWGTGGRNLTGMQFRNTRGDGAEVGAFCSARKRQSDVKDSKGGYPVQQG